MKARHTAHPAVRPSHTVLVVSTRSTMYYRLSDIDDDHLISEVPAAAKELAGVAAGAVASELISRLASGKES